jgi:hypothetical protein
LGVVLSVAAQVANAQSPIITVTLGPNQIGQVNNTEIARLNIQ